MYSYGQENKKLPTINTEKKRERHSQIQASYVVTSYGVSIWPTPPFLLLEERPMLVGGDGTYKGLMIKVKKNHICAIPGDFRTGRAINMRRVIPYIASHFRKDRIWLRRTKPAKREYKIAIAIDDSSSMSDNRSKELAFESLALVSQVCFHRPIREPRFNVNFLNGKRFVQIYYLRFSEQ